MMREHYKTEFHRFNIKRKQANLPPVPENLFNQKRQEMINRKQASKGDSHLKQESKIKKQRSQDTSSDTSNTTEDSSQNRNQKNIPGQQKLQITSPSLNREKTEDELIEEKISRSPQLSLSHSLFDNHISDSMQTNLKYMTEKFGFFFPSIDRVSDLPGLLKYLGQKISVGNTCLYCEKTFYSLEGVQTHMRDKSHCMIQWFDPGEYSDFYEDPVHKTFVDNMNEGGELQDTESIYVEEGTGQLVLAESNKIIGHRAYKLYYKQRQHSQAHKQLITSLLQEHKRLAMIAHQKSVNMDNKAIRRRQDHALKLGLTHNNQRHYRDQNPII
eukprot:TRINITY_DN4780_c0_g1_i2.p1 TRINITY_DN4780_c0_g1~~TRINITY_DN4780_c0_g1_i2.p1  ORF type:complete len:328 (+),score=62.26 TRINITY_DN4780_c0_g1_i2:167-1150(+)